MGEPLEPGDSARSFREIAEHYNLSQRQIAYARLSGVQTAESFYVFLQHADDLEKTELFDIPDVSARLQQSERVQAFISASGAAESSEVPLSFGATAPEGAAFKIGDEAPEPTDEEIAVLASFQTGPLANEPAILATECGPWPVRNQLERGTCVSFAMTALYELYECVQSGETTDLSEQFLYWAIKHHNLDGIPNQDGTWLEYACQALEQYGICAETGWPYNGTFLPANISHNPPQAGAVADAIARKTRVAKTVITNQHSGKAAILLSALRQHNGAAAISLPVFSSKYNKNNHNWNTPVSIDYGEVMNPAPHMVADGGHAVCCVGFIPDPYEPLGGHFIIRNSWGTMNWGRYLPSLPAYFAPRPGYGQVSATYVDRYLWDYAVF